MSEVRVKEGESLDSALKRFKRSCLKRKQKSDAARKNRKKFY